MTPRGCKAPQLVDHDYSGGGERQSRVITLMKLQTILEKSWQQQIVVRQDTEVLRRDVFYAVQDVVQATDVSAVSVIVHPRIKTREFPSHKFRILSGGIVQYLDDDVSIRLMQHAQDSPL
jgi:hypothetical protein